MAGQFSIRATLLALFLTTASWASGPGAKPWAPFGPDGGDARRIAPDPSDHAHLYLGTTNGWIYESHDAGRSWTRLAQIGKRDDLVLDSIVVDPQNPKHVVVGAWVIDHYDGGVFYSWNGGATWTPQAEMRGQSVLALTQSISDPKTMVAGTLQGVFRSTDGGQRWKRISSEDNKEIHEVQSVAIDPHDPNIIYAGTWHLPWKTTDAGEHWDNIKQGIIEDSDVFSIIVDPIAPETVFASACSGIYKSDNAGLLFRKVPGIPSSARRTRRLLQDPHHLETVFAGTTEGLYRSDDAGKTFQLLTPAGVIVNDVAVDLADSKRVLIATDRGGVMASEDGGATFHSSNAGFSARQVTALKRDVKHPSTLYAGVVNDKDWGGVFESDNEGQNWIQRSDGLEGRDVFSLGQAPDGTMIAGTVHGLFRLDHVAQTWARVMAAPGAPGANNSVEAILTRPPAPIGEDIQQVAPMDPAASSGADPAIEPAKPSVRKPQHKTVKRTAAQQRARPLTARQHAPAAQQKARPLVARQHAPAKKSTAPIVPTNAQVFDGSVYAIVTSNETLLAATSVGLLTSQDDGLTWVATGPRDSSDWRFMASARKNVIAASLRSVMLSSDSGIIWEPVKLPEILTQIATVAVEPSGEIWVGGREGVFVSSDAGNTWSIPKNLYLNAVNSVFYDETSSRMTITSSGNSSLVFTVLLPGKQVNFTDAGWNLRFARPLGDHMIAATLFDGIVVQPRMVASPLVAQPAALAPPHAAIAEKPAATARTKQD